MNNDRNDIIRLDSLEIGYLSGRIPVPILPPLSASSAGGELIAIAGRNGIGKSTLLRTLAGLQQALAGEVLIAGRSISSCSRIELAKKIGYISTEVVRVSNMSVYDLVTLGRFPHTNWLGTIDQNDRVSIEKSITRTGLSSMKERNISEISDGERQKAMIARVLAQDTEILIMDEPTAFLDIASKYEIISLMLELTREGKTILFSTHDFNIAVNQADKIWLILDDRLIEGAPEDLFMNGAFEHLFDSSVVKFNSAEGDFSFHTASNRSVYLEGDGPVRKWTEHALTRAGFRVSPSITDPRVRITGNPENRWLILRDNTESACSSLYDLVRRLRE